MRLELTGRHVEITPLLRRLVDRKLARLDRLLNDAAVSAQIVLSNQKRGRRTDITLHARGEKFLHGFGESGTWETSLSQAIDKLSQQAARVKGKWKERHRPGTRQPVSGPAQREAPAARSAGARSGSAAPGRPRMPRVLRASRQSIVAMSIGDALRRAEKDGDGVVVFRNAETSAIAVLVRRANGEMTLIETD
jgi:putative sigma-54 modulation protein